MSEEDQTNKVATAAGVSSRGRILKRPGISEKKLAALDKLRDVQSGNVRPLDQYKASEEVAVFEQVEMDEYERRQESRKNDDFIVDDEGYGYTDRGGEIWEYEDHQMYGQSKGKKQRKTNVKNNHGIDEFMQPMSTVAPIKKKSTQIVKKQPINVSEAQSKDIMNSLLGELDKNDEDDLQEIGQAVTGALDQMGTDVLQDDGQVAFNQNDKLNQKYNIAVNQIGSKKRTMDQISNVAAQRRHNPFAKSGTDEHEAISLDEVANVAAERNDNPFRHSNAADVGKTANGETRQSLPQRASEADRNQTEHAAPEVQPQPMVTDDASKMQEDMLDKAANEDKFDLKTKETEMEKEWRQIQQNQLNQEQKKTGSDVNQHQQLPLKLNEDGTLSFYWFDAHEENYGADLYLFGKVWQPETQSFVSCSLKVQGMERTIFVYPKVKNGAQRQTMSEEEEKALKESMIMEFNTMRANQFKKITKFKCKFVSRKYCFEMPIPHGEHKFLKIKYSATEPPLPTTLKGNTFECIFGANQSMLELFILKRKIKGPCWLRIKNPIKNTQFKQTWCKHEVYINDPKNVDITLEELNRQSPPLTCLSFSLKTSRSAENTNEIAMISCLVQNQINQDGPTNDNSQMHRFSLVRRLPSYPWPFDLQQRLKQSNQSNIQLFNNERQLIEAFVAKFFTIDPDVMLSHNLCGSVFEIIMARIQMLKIPHWSRIGRLKKQNFPMRRADQTGYSGSQWLPRISTCGRLLVDTYVSSKELVRETNYDLSNLAQRQLKTERQEFDDDLLPQFYLKSERIMQLVQHTEKDTFLTYKLMMHLNILPLTKQLTTIAGNLWFRSLQNARAERNEMLLLHEFRAKKFLCPDKSTLSSKEQRKADFGDDDLQQETQKKTVKGKRQKAKYGGGLVLDPKAGFYDNIVMMLDFNSLYPSIIQEYNLCFTTVERKPTKSFDGMHIKKNGKQSSTKLDFGNQNGQAEAQESEEEEEEAQVPSGSSATCDAILPNILKNLVKKRKLVKQQMKQEKNDRVKYQQLNIRQTALKLTANSMYGCLGFTSSRFHAQAIAALITRTGRETLMKTKEIAETKLGFSVIYGDTDSIMINTGTTQVKESIDMGNKLKHEVNQLYKCLEIEIDGIFQSMLLLKKKKYAALVVENFGTPDQKTSVELKGLDMVRRDWCQLSKTLGNFVLNQILSGKQREDVILKLNEYLSDIGQKLKAGEIPLSDFIITKQLTRKAEDYTDPKNLPHVQVAIRMKQQGKSDADLVNNFIPYVICKNSGGDQGRKATIGDFAYSPEEYMDKKKNLQIDTDWYITQQLLPPITRLIEHIDGIEVDFVAQCLGVDSKKFKFSHKNDAYEDEQNKIESIANPILKSETTKKLYDRTIATLKIICPHCDHSFDMPAIYHTKQKELKIRSDKCINCQELIPAPYIQNRVRLFLKQLQAMYYKGNYTCVDPSCSNKTRSLLHSTKCNVLGCKNRVKADISELQVNDTLRYLQTLFDAKKYIDEQRPANPDDRVELRDIANATMLDKTKPFVDNVLQKSKFNNVDLATLFKFIPVQ